MPKDKINQFEYETTSIRTGRLEVRVTKILMCDPDPQDTGNYNAVVMNREGDILRITSGKTYAGRDGVFIAQVELRDFLADHEEWRKEDK